MGVFVAAVPAFPAVVFTFALVVVVAFWLCVLIGAVEHDAFEDASGTGVLGLGGVPPTVSVSLWVAVAWVLSLVGGVLFGSASPSSGVRAVVDVGVPAAAVLAAWLVTRAALHPLRHLFPDEPGPSRHDFVGLTSNFALEAGNNVQHYGPAISGNGCRGAGLGADPSARSTSASATAEAATSRVRMTGMYAVSSARPDTNA